MYEAKSISLLIFLYRSIALRVAPQARYHKNTNAKYTIGLSSPILKRYFNQITFVSIPDIVILQLREPDASILSLINLLSILVCTSSTLFSYNSAFLMLVGYLFKNKLDFVRFSIGYPFGLVYSVVGCSGFKNLFEKGCWYA